MQTHGIAKTWEALDKGVQWQLWDPEFSCQLTYSWCEKKFRQHLKAAVWTHSVPLGNICSACYKCNSLESCSKMPLCFNQVWWYDKVMKMVVASVEWSASSPFSCGLWDRMSFLHFGRRANFFFLLAYFNWKAKVHFWFTEVLRHCVKYIPTQNTNMYSLRYLL